MNSVFKKNFQKTLIVASTLLFLSQNLLSESIIKENKIHPSSKSHLLGEYKFDDFELYISNSFIRLIYNCEYFTFGNVCSQYNINFKEDAQILNHKVFEIEIKNKNYTGLLLTFDNGQFGFYLFDEKKNKNTFVTLEMFEEHFLKNKKVTTNLRKEDNLLVVSLNVGNDFAKNYVIDLNDFKSKRLNIN